MENFKLLILILFAFSIVNAQSSNESIPKEMSVKTVVSARKANPEKIPKVETSPTIDGIPDDEIWKSATKFNLGFQTYPGENTEATKPTEVLVMYDEEYLYVAFRCWDDRDKIRATIAKRDGILADDNVRIWLDTYNDQRRAYVLAFNPLGIQQDGIYSEGEGLPDYSIDIVMESKGVIQEWGWSVEAKIPFKSLRYKAGKGKMWGFNVIRNIKHLNSEFNSWMPEDRNISGTLIQHGKITGLDEIKSERTLEIIPSITLSETGRRVRTIPRFQLQPNSIDTGRFVNEPIKQDIGVNLKYTITPNITLDAAINPDFAEIETDAPIVTANRRFPVFFPEKRPFFLEGVDIFQSPTQVFYSRTIIDPDFAAKLTGKVGKNSFGFLVASDNAPGDFDEDDANDPSVRPRIDEFLNKNALFAVLRLKRDMGKENNVGFFGTARIFPEQRNFLGGFDGRFKLNDKTVSQFQVVGTHSRKCFFETTFDPLNEPFQAQRNREICGGNTYNLYRTGNGLSYYANVNNEGRTRGWFLEIGGKTSDYRADAGFTQQTNTNEIFGYYRINKVTDSTAKLVSLRSFQFSSIRFDWQGRFQNYIGGANVSFGFQKNTSLFIESNVRREKVYEDEFGLTRNSSRNGAFFGLPMRSVLKSQTFGIFNSSPIKQFSVRLLMRYTFNEFDFDFGAGKTFPRISPAALAGDSRLDPGSGNQFDIQADITYKPTDPLQFTFRYDKSRMVRNDTGRTAFDTNIFSFRSTYQFTRFLFTRIRWDYNTLRRNASGQMIFGWNPNPGTAFYIGYNDDFNYGGFSPFTGQHEPRFERNSRTFFIRVSYLFRKSF